LPRKEKERLEMPPEVSAPGHCFLISGSEAMNYFA